MKIGFPQEERRGNLALRNNMEEEEVKIFPLQHVLTSHIYVAKVQCIRVVSKIVNFII